MFNKLLRSFHRVLSAYGDALKKQLAHQIVWNFVVMLLAYVLAPGFIEASSFPKPNVFSEISIFGPQLGMESKENQSGFALFGSGPRFVSNRVNKFNEFRGGRISFVNSIDSPGTKRAHESSDDAGEKIAYDIHRKLARKFGATIVGAVIGLALAFPISVLLFDGPSVLLNECRLFFHWLIHESFGR